MSCLEAKRLNALIDHAMGLNTKKERRQNFVNGKKLFAVVTDFNIESMISELQNLSMNSYNSFSSSQKLVNTDRHPGKSRLSLEYTHLDNFDTRGYFSNQKRKNSIHKMNQEKKI